MLGTLEASQMISVTTEKRVDLFSPKFQRVSHMISWPHVLRQNIIEVGACGRVSYNVTTAGNGGKQQKLQPGSASISIASPDNTTICRTATQNTGPRDTSKL